MVNGNESQFIDLRDSGSEPRPFSIGDSTRGYSWHPDGRFAIWDENGTVALIDPETRAVTRLTVRGPLNDVLAWTADGSALLAYGEAGDGIAFGENVNDDGMAGDPP